MQCMDTQPTNTRRARSHIAVVATLAILIAVVLWQAYGPWLLSPSHHVIVN